MSIYNLLLGYGGGSSYTISNSLRFRSSASAYLNRAFGTPTNNKIWTYSIWVKRGVLGVEQELLNASTVNAQFSFLSGDTLYFYDGTSGASYTTTQVFRDPSSWYHFLVAEDTTQATAGNRVKIYVNGVQITSFSTGTAPTQNNASAFNAASAIHNIGRYVNGGTITNYFDGYMAEVNFIDGQALTPTSFGAFSTVTGVWQPIAYTGTYGTNGFYLKFASFGTAAALGTDSSGNGNTWTVNNISVTAGTTYDPMLDSPTLTSATVANYAVLNQLGKASTGVVTNADLTFTNSSATTYPAIGATTFVSSGKWYWESVVSGSGAFEVTVGISTLNTFTSTSFSGGSPLSAYWNSAQGIGKNQSYLSATPTFTYGDVIGIAYDADAGTVTFYKNNTAQTPVVTGVTGTYAPAISINYYTVPTIDINFGQRPFTYTPPSGFVRLNAYNLATPTIANGALYMAATTYAGNSSTQTISNGANTTTNVVFRPDLVWVKDRTSGGNSHNLSDIIRGATNGLASNLTVAEYSIPAFASFNSNGFSLSTGSGVGQVNTTGDNYIAWQWIAGAGSSSSNTNGSVTSTVSVSPTSGFSIVTFTAPASGNFTVGHGLGITPAMVIVKNRNGGSFSWYTWHQSFSSATNSYVILNGTQAVDNTTYNMWGASGNNSSTLGFTVGTSTIASSAEVAYCWSAVAGYSAFGSYTGNGSADGPFVYTGFRPRFVMIKRTNDISDWTLRDTSRDTYNAATAGLFADLASAESTQAAIDILSNGFKCRDAGGGATNASGSTYIYAAFAENPFNYSLAR
jgi:hypothetical protein